MKSIINGICYFILMIEELIILAALGMHLVLTKLFPSHDIYAESLSETVPRSLRLSCGSELTRQGISLP